MSKISLNKNDLGLNNKFGLSCGYPALMSDGHYFTTWISSRIFNDGLQKNLKVTGSHNYRDILQNSATTLMNNEVYQYEKTRCEPTKDNIFYIDSTKYAPNKKLGNEYVGQKMINNGIKRSEPASFK